MNLKLPPIFDVYEGESPVLWEEMQPKPLLAILKASGKFFDGFRREDFQVNNYAAQCKALTIQIGLYHFLLPNNITEQAQLFLGVYNRLSPDIAPIVDVECNPMTYNVSQAQWVSQLKTFLDLLEAGAHAKPIIYTSRNFWGYTLDADGRAPSWTDDYGLWVAWYPNDPDAFYAPPTSVMPKGWTHWELWQYSDGGRSAGFLANDLNIASPAFAATIGGSEPEAYVIERSLADYGIWFTPESGELPLLSAVEAATQNGWECAMNAGAGFSYTDANHAIPRVAGFEQVNGIPYARRLLTGGIVNPALWDNGSVGPWSILAFRVNSVALIVTRGLEGSEGMTQAGAAEWCKAHGYTDAYLMDSGRSCQIAENSQSLYWPYNERVPQHIGLKRKSITGGNMATKGTCKAGMTANVKRMVDSVIVAQMAGEDTVYGDLSSARTDILNFDHFYRATGARFELGALCKVSLTNLTFVENVTEPTATPPPAAVVPHLHQTLIDADGTSWIFDADGVKA